VSTDTTTLDIVATPAAVFKRNAVEALHSVICEAVPPEDAFGDDSSEDMCFPNTVAIADPVTGRHTDENDDTVTPT
jgi:hypothetical protein